MSKSKKAIITLSVVSAVILIALVTVVAVWAATSQTVTSQLTVRYSATNVTADVKAEYKLAGATTYTTIGSTSFAATDATTSKAVNADEIALDDTKTSVLFRYTFMNYGGNTITVSLGDTLPTATNMIVTYAKSNAEADPETSALTGNKVAAFDLGPSDGTDPTTAYVFIKVAISDQSRDANYAGTLTWNLANKAA